MVILITVYGNPNPVVDGIATLSSQFTANARFLDMTCTWGELFDELEKMCNLHGWSCINQHRGSCFNEFNSSEYFGDTVHPTHLGYLHYGQFLSGKVASLYSNMMGN